MPASRAIASIETPPYPRSRITSSAASISCSRRCSGAIRGAYRRRGLAERSDERGPGGIAARQASGTRLRASAFGVAPASFAFDHLLEDLVAPLVRAEQPVALAG